MRRVERIMSLMLTRIITAIVALVAFIPILIYSNTWAFPIAVAFLSLVGVIEMLRCIDEKKLSVRAVSMILAVLSPVYARFAGSTSEFLSPFCAAVFFYLVFLLALSVFSHGKLDVSHTAMTFTMVFYIISAFTSLVLIRDTVHGHILYLLAFLGPWMSDSAAYFCGRAFGRHKLIPDVSPKKTVEGALGGVVFCGIAFSLYGFIISRFFITSVKPSYLILFVIGVCVSAISQIGDLIASLIKRKYGIKDYGKLFPGHGGVMDRFDSVLITAPLLLIVAELSEFISLF